MENVYEMFQKSTAFHTPFLCKIARNEAKYTTLIILTETGIICAKTAAMLNHRLICPFSHALLQLAKIGKLKRPQTENSFERKIPFFYQINKFNNPICFLYCLD